MSTALVEKRQDCTIITSPCHKRRARVPRTHGTVSVKCPEPGCGRWWTWTLSSGAVAAPSPVVAREGDVIVPASGNRDVVPPDRSGVAVPEPPRPPGKTGGIVQVFDTRELRFVCAKTGARWSAVFNRALGMEKFVLVGTRAGETRLIDELFARANANPHMHAEKPRDGAFDHRQFAFGNLTCPCCGYVGRPGRNMVVCCYCDELVCGGNIVDVRDDWEQAQCQPRCPSYPAVYRLEPSDDPLHGSEMRVYQKDGS
jgi:hypothetical protein